MTAIHLKERLTLVLVDLAKKEHRTPEFLLLNPNGKVPLLDDNGFHLWESHAIMQCMADRTPGDSRADLTRSPDRPAVPALDGPRRRWDINKLW